MNELPDGQWDEQEDESCSMIRKQGTPAPVPAEEQPRQRHSLWRAIGVFLGICRDYTADDLRQLKDAGMKIAVGRGEQEMAKARRENAEAQKTVEEAQKIAAEAAEIHERIDAPRRQDALKAMELRVAAMTKDVEIEVARKGRADAEAARAIAMASAIERLCDAISTIRSKGGNVAFDSDQLIHLLDQGIAENPDDASLREAQENLLEPADGDEDEANE